MRWLGHLLDFTDTTARPFAHTPRHCTRPLRSSTLAAGLSPSRSRKPGVSSEAETARRALSCPNEGWHPAREFRWLLESAVARRASESYGD
jgi:hypothetical protein